MKPAPVILALALAACVKPLPEGTGPITIRNDGGGTLGEYIARRSQLEASGRDVLLYQDCASACTIFLSLPNFYMCKGSRLRFHGADGLPVARDLAEAKIASYYPEPISDLYLSEWRNIDPGEPMATLTRAQVRAIWPEVNFCEERDK